MTIKIGDKEFATTKPGDLNDRLLAAKGCSEGEAKSWLVGSPTAGLVEAALRPFLGADAPSPAEVAQLIAAVGVADVAPLVLALYADGGTGPELEAEAVAHGE